MSRNRRPTYKYEYRDGEDGGWVCTRSDYPRLEGIGLTKSEAKNYLDEAITAHKALEE